MDFKGEKGFVLAAVATALGMLFLDITILPVALPSIQKELLCSENSLQWVINAYIMALAVFQLVGGRLADMKGRRFIFTIGMLLFICSSMLGALSPNVESLIIARSFQGMGAAFMGPSAFAILVTTFPEKERGRALGIAVSIASIFLSIGPFIGGVLSEYISWRAVFYMNVPLSIFGLSVILKKLKKSPKLPDTFDFPTFILFTFGLFCLILAVMQVKVWGGDNPWIYILLVLFVVCFGALRFSTKRAKHSFIDFSLYKDRFFRGGNIMFFFVQFCLSIVIFWPIFFQNVIGLSPVEAGTFTLVATFPNMIFATISGHWYDKKGPRNPVCFAFFLMSIGFAIIGIFTYFIDYYLFQLVGYILFGTAIPFVMTPISATSIKNVKQKQRGEALAMNGAVRFFSNSLGIAVIGSVQFLVTHSRVSSLLKQSGYDKEFGYDRVKYILENGATSNLKSLSLKIKQVVVQGQIQGMMIVDFSLMLVAILGLIIAWNVFRKEDKPSTTPNTEIL